MKQELLMGLMALTRSTQTGFSLRQILPRVLTLLVLGIAAGLLLLVIVVGLLIALHQTLIMAEWSGIAALWTTIGAAIAVFAALVGGMVYTVRRIRPTVRSPLDYVERVTQAFMDGINTTRK